MTFMTNNMTCISFQSPKSTHQFLIFRKGIKGIWASKMIIQESWKKTEWIILNVLFVQGEFSSPMFATLIKWVTLLFCRCHASGGLDPALTSSRGGPVGNRARVDNFSEDLLIHLKSV